MDPMTMMMLAQALRGRGGAGNPQQSQQAPMMQQPQLGRMPAPQQGQPAQSTGFGLGQSLVQGGPGQGSPAQFAQPQQNMGLIQALRQKGTGANIAARTAQGAMQGGAMGGVPGALMGGAAGFLKSGGWDKMKGAVAPMMKNIFKVF